MGAPAQIAKNIGNIAKQKFDWKVGDAVFATVVGSALGASLGTGVAYVEAHIEKFGIMKTFFGQYSYLGHMKVDSSTLAVGAVVGAAIGVTTLFKMKGKLSERRTLKDRFPRLMAGVGEDKPKAPNGP